jgi:hypothetical protein
VVAVHLAEGLAAQGRADRPATVAHLVAALAGEPEGLAGTVLRQRFGDVAARLALHPAVGAAALPAVRTAFVAVPVLDRPCWTLELLAAARRVGGEDLEALLEDCGINLAGFADDLHPVIPTPDEVGESAGAPETYGRLSLLSRGFSADADLAVARTRAAGGDSRALLAWLGAAEETRAALAAAPAVAVDRVVARAAVAGAPVQGTDVVTAITHLSLRAVLDGR